MTTATPLSRSSCIILSGSIPDYACGRICGSRQPRFESELCCGRRGARALRRPLRRSRNGSQPRHARVRPVVRSGRPGVHGHVHRVRQIRLNWSTDRIYRALPPDVVNSWNFKRGGFFGRVLAPTVIPDLREAAPTRTSASSRPSISRHPSTRRNTKTRRWAWTRRSGRGSLGYYPSGHAVTSARTRSARCAPISAASYATAVTPH